MQWLLFLGIAGGMRTMTPIAVLCWAAWLGFLPQRGWTHWTAYLFSAIVFGLFAIGEYIGDTLPSTPSRKSLGPAVTRILFGGFVGYLASRASFAPVGGGILLGVVGAAIGTWGGWWVRHRVSKAVGHDLPVALAGSALALGVTVLSVAMLHKDAAVELLHTTGEVIR